MDFELVRDFEEGVHSGGGGRLSAMVWGRGYAAPSVSYSPLHDAAVSELYSHLFQPAQQAVGMGGLSKRGVCERVIVQAPIAIPAACNPYFRIPHSTPSVLGQ